MGFEFTSEQTQRLPIHIAKTTELLRSESNQRLRLWYSFELTEMVLKWVFAVSSAAVYNANGTLTRKMHNVIRDSIRTPTLGGWQNMARTACDELKTFGDKTESIRPFAEFFRKYDTKGKRAHPAWTRIKNMRNLVVHAGGLTENQARKYWFEIRTDMTAILVDLSDLHDEFDVWARFAEVTYNLEGSEAKRADCPFHLPDGDGAWLIDASGWPCPLRPLLVYEPVLETWEIEPVRNEERDVRTPVPQSYFKLEKGQLFYTPIGVDDNISINADLSLFKRIFTTSLEASDTTIYQRQLAGLWSKHVQRFHGRSEELRALEKWRDKTSSDGNKIGLIVGEPGLGKSALIAVAAWSYERAVSESKTESLRSVAHVFSAEDPLNDRRNFLLNLVQQLEIWLARKRSAAKAADQAAELAETVKVLLSEVFSRYPENHLTIFVDGLDEIAMFDSKFPGLLMSILRPGVTIIAATRNLSFLRTFEESEKVERIRFAGGADMLPGMSDNEVRALLLEGLGARAKEVISLDQDNDSGKFARNAYIDKIVERAAGKPLYIELLIVDLVENRVPIDPLARLPISIERYYEKLLSRQGLSDTKSHLSIILCLLALAREPLSKLALVDVFVRSPGAAVSWDVAQAWVQGALDQGEVFLRTAEGFDRQATIVIYHQELKRFILGPEGDGAPQLRWAFGLARWMFANGATDPTATRHVETRHHFERFGLEYLLDHADYVRPAILSQPAADHVENHIATEDQLRTSLEAWNNDREAFLNGFSRIFLKLRGEVEAHSNDPILQRVLGFFLTATEKEITSNVVHAVYGYYDKTMPIFTSFVDLVMSEEFLSGLDLTGAGEMDVTNWRIKAGNLDRRKGRLKQANETFAAAERRLDSVEGAREATIAKMRSLLLYEQGYVAYQSSDGPLTDRLFSESARLAREAGDINGEYIAESVRLDRKVKFSLATGQDVTRALDEAEHFLMQALAVFSEKAQTAPKEDDRLTAERWVMNCKAHLFEVAFQRGDISLAVDRYEILLSDKWMMKDENTREEIVKRYRPRAALIQGETDLAIAEYEKALPVITSPMSSDAHVEAIAQSYLEFARVLVDARQFEKAKLRLRSGLLTSDDMANAIWKPALQEALVALS